MKMILASSLLVVLNIAPPCFASCDSAQTASDVSAVTALSVLAVPVCVGAAGAYVGTGLAIGSGHQLIKLVDKSGDGLSDLTSDGIDLLFPLDYREKTISVNYGANGTYIPYVTIQKKQIPLIVRKGYVELNEQVNQREKLDANLQGSASVTDGAVIKPGASCSSNTVEKKEPVAGL